MTSITVATENTTYDSRDNCNAIIETASNTLIAGCKNTAIPESVTSIGNSAFFGCYGLTSVTIPNGVTAIGACAFERCYDITSVALPKGLKGIGNRAFYWCRNLTSITFHEKLESIGDNSFEDCNLTSIVIPEGVKSIGSEAFKGCSALESISIPKSIEHIGGKAFDGTAWYEKQPDGLIYLGSVAYKYKGSMPSDTEIVLKDETTCIAGEAFIDCSGLATIKMPEGLKYIGEGAFARCTNLRSLTIPKKVKSIGKRAFEDIVLTQLFVECQQPPTIYQDGTSSYNTFSLNLQRHSKLYVPVGTKDIYQQTRGWEMFCFIIDDEEPDEVSFSSDGINYHVISIQNKEVEVVARTPGYEGDVVIPAKVTNNGNTYTVTRIGVNAFDNSFENDNISSIKLPWTIKNIQSGWRSYCDIYIEDLTAWCNVDFYICGATLPIDWEESYNLYVNGKLISDLVIPYGVKEISDAAFQRFRIKSVTIPSSVKRIGNKAFCGSSLEKVTIPSNIQSIGLCAFSGCTKLQSLTIENGISEIGPSAFSDCVSLTEVTLPSSVKRLHNFAFRNCTNLKKVKLSQGLERIGEWVFAWCPNLTSVSMPGSLKSIGRNAFTSCEGLKTVNLNDGLERIDRYAFNRCVSLQTLKIPASVSYIGRNVVEDCHSLKELEVESSNKKYDSRHNCNAIFETATNTIVVAAPEATIPQGTEVLGNYAFAYCTDRQSVTLPEELKFIGERAFLHCWSLHTITIPESVDSIGDAAFDACEGLTDVLAMANRPCAINEHSFTDETYRRATLYVPDEAVDYYRKANGWERFNLVKGLTQLPMSIEPIIDRADKEVQIEVRGNRVLLSNLNYEEPVCVHLLDGRLVKMVKAAPDGCAIVILPTNTNNIYIVRTSRRSIKVKP